MSAIKEQNKVGGDDADDEWPENVSLIEGNLLDCKEMFMIHQCNCITMKGAHLSGDVFARFPYADIYAERADRAKHAGGGRDVPGTIIVRGDLSKNQRLIINMLAQYYPGKSRFGTDTFALRQQWFQSCLVEIAKLANLSSLAFPYNIGCGAAGGHWPTYQKMLMKFARTVPNTRITIYKLPNSSPPLASSPIPIPVPPPKQTNLHHFIIKSKK
jgi:hypothetical protein